jgi:cob(I)alamin adenosyltransferase
MPTSTPIDSDKDNPRPFAAIEAEMRAKQAIKLAEKEYQENLDRARDLSALGAAICTSFKEKSRLDSEDLKKLEKVEKLTKGIRNAAGGSDDDVALDKPPANLASAMADFASVTKSLKENVEKTPKRVVSTAVIDEANVLLQLIRILRYLTPKV